MVDSENRYRRTFETLEKKAAKFWPSELAELEDNLSVIPVLLKTQDQFIGILGVETPDLERLFTIVESSTLPPHHFLKHLVILSDFSGELLGRVSREFGLLFPDGKLHYYHNGAPHSYTFRAVPKRKFSNSSLRLASKEMVKSFALSDLMKDAIAILLFGSAYSGEDKEITSVLAKCEIGDYIGKPDVLSNFIKQRYIWVSSVTRGAKANSLGQLAQKFVAEYIKEKLSALNVKTGGRLPSVSHTDLQTGRDTAFDLVVSNETKHAAIEVSFQVTTNSTIERKAGQARSRFNQVEAAGHKIAYVIDGSGNFQREPAMRTILSHSHCSVAFSRSELDLLCEFLAEFFEL
jgi:hypothetical protein